MEHNRSKCVRCNLSATWKEIYRLNIDLELISSGSILTVQNRLQTE
jgi:hypothetical protein